MWVVKIGGSMNRDPLLPQWLELLATLGRGRVVLVPGGGRFADEAREAQRHWGFDDVAAHNMAVFGMAQTAMMWQGLAPALRPALREHDIRRVLHQGGTALWLPLQLLREQPDALTSWDVSSDSLALWLARQLNAERLVVLKSCPLDGGQSLEGLVQAGVLDRCFASMAAEAAFPIELLSRAELERMRALLVDERCGAVSAGGGASALR